MLKQDKQLLNWMVTLKRSYASRPSPSKVKITLSQLARMGILSNGKWKRTGGRHRFMFSKYCYHMNIAMHNSTLVESTKMEDGITCMAFTVSFVPNTGNKFFVAACDAHLRLYDFEEALASRKICICNYDTCFVIYLL